ncbi:MAG TPA: hypothetical protein VFS83_09720 [Ktedonobacterales bacterium]|nr:hypothetical protein [Ktedonobacterales bacterium]
MTSGMQSAPVASPTRQRVAAWSALALALIHPLATAGIALTLPGQELRDGGILAVLLQSVYGGVICFVWPLPIIAAYLATLVLMDARSDARIAWAAIVISAISLLAIATAVIVGLAFFTHFQ